MRPRLLEYFASHDIGITLPGYTALYIVMTAFCIFLSSRIAVRRGHSGTRFFLATLLTVFISLAGARLYGLFLIRAASPGISFVDLVQLGETGSFGAYLGGILGAVGAARLLKLDALGVLDIYAPCMALSVGLGRIGCFLAGCCYGEITSLPWAVAFPRGSAVYVQHQIAGMLSPHAALSLPVHPTQLYEALFGLSIAAFLFHAARTIRGKGGLIAAFLVAYSCFRFFIEFIRADRELALGPLSVAQILALVTLGIGMKLGSTTLKRRQNLPG